MGGGGSASRCSRGAGTSGCDGGWGAGGTAGTPGSACAVGGRWWVESSVGQRRPVGYAAAVRPACPPAHCQPPRMAGSLRGCRPNGHNDRCGDKRPRSAGTVGGATVAVTATAPFVAGGCHAWRGNGDQVPLRADGRTYGRETGVVGAPSECAVRGGRKRRARQRGTTGRPSENAGPRPVAPSPPQRAPVRVYSSSAPLFSACRPNRAAAAATDNHSTRSRSSRL